MKDCCADCGDLCERQPVAETFDALLTAADIREMAQTGGRLEGHWAITIFFPNKTTPFQPDRLWVDLLNTLTESCGVKITTVRFKEKPNVLGCEFGLREE